MYENLGAVYHGIVPRLALLALALALALALIAAATAPARAQSATTGAIAGRVVGGDGAPLAHVLVSVSSAATRDAHATTTAEDGTYKLTGLAPGWYVIAFDHRYATATTHAGIRVHAGAVAPVFQTLVPGSRAPAFQPAPPLDVTSAELGGTVDRAFLTRVPIASRDALGAAGVWPGVQGDRLGLSIAGSSGLENRHFVDGLDFTSPRFGDAPSSLLHEFVDEVRLVSGGYRAEWGGSTGGLLHLVTRRGSNHLRGSVFGTFAPRQLATARTPIPRAAAPTSVEAERAYAADVGFDVSGPLVRDRLWFYVGFAPQLVRDDHTRITRRFSDCRRVQPDGTLSGCDPRDPRDGGHADGLRDVDPATGAFVMDEIDREVRAGTSTAYAAIARLDLALPPAHQAQLLAIAAPSRRRTPDFSAERGEGSREDAARLDTAARWTSTLHGGRTELEAFAGWHHARRDTGALDPRRDALPRQFVSDLPPEARAALGLESDAVIQGCTDGVAGDPYPLIANCAPRSYALGGPGELAREREDRFTARVSALRRVERAGTHELKAGLDLDDSRLATPRLYSGGAQLSGQTRVTVERWVQLAAPDNRDPRFDQTCATPGPDGTTSTFRCAHLPGTPDTEPRDRAIHWAAYLRDSWRPHPSLTLDAGLRYEEQRLRGASFAPGTIGARGAAGDAAIDLRGNLAPRLAAVWDPTGIGEAKLFSSWGRYFQPVPLHLVARMFGGDVLSRQTFDATASAAPCGPPDPRTGLPDPLGCLSPSGPPVFESLSSAAGLLLAPGLRAPYLDELTAGGEVLLDRDTRLGAVLRRRTLGRVLEDVSSESGATFALTHPPGATRDHRALEVVIARRLTRGLFAQASYTYARTTGSYPGLISHENGQIDPHSSSQFDFPELAANRAGPLPVDRPHLLELDGHYTRMLGRDHALTLGTRVRAISGTPVSVLGAHELYGASEVFLLPRGRFARTPFARSLDLHVGYTRRLPRGLILELYADVFNVLDQQDVSAVDQRYAADQPGASTQYVRPISGGAYEDLLWAKGITSFGGETATPIGRNPNFGNPITRYAPTAARLGFRVTF